MVCGALLGVLLALEISATQEPPRRFGGVYSELDARRRQLIDDWLARFAKVTGQKLDARAFYDDILSLSTKTTFEAVTHALLTTALTDASGEKFGDGLALIERVDTVKGEVSGASSDRQFRMYVRLTADARAQLERSREFKRGMDNAVYHKGYPLNYREQRGTPSIQVSIAHDGRQADVDVDYRSSSFPVNLFNGHLSASNSDVRAGNNADRHAERWTGFRNWWRSFLGVRLEKAPDDTGDSAAVGVLPKVPRAGKKDIEAMVSDFLHAWLVEGDIVAAMGYVSERSYACLAEDAPDPSAFDRGLAPFQIMVNLKAAREALGNPTSLEGLTTGVRLTVPGLRVVTQPHHAQFVLYDVRDDIATRFDCASRLTPGAPTQARAYGRHFGATFRVASQGKDAAIALLWAKEDGYWRIVSWQTAPEPDETPAPPTPPEPTAARIGADLPLVHAAHEFMESWLIRKDYDAAFRFLSTRSYACYDVVRGPDRPASSSPDDAASKTRASLERVGQWVGAPGSLEAIVEAADPLHPSIRVMDQPYSRTFSLTSFPTALADVVECDARARGATPPDPLPLAYGDAFGMTFRFRTQGGDAPVLRLLWRKDGDAWRIRAYDVEAP
jgi:hypothetical protein